ncbi:galactokinase [Klebsiella pneumoniae subsp. ozaenae]|uniref:Galactokinase n=1 Tax=Klebsiella pneumoniae subsp. ozaenae TaxID=574 RepID=A0A377ZBF7_KLEPO|nr:galactokinase [Klebsiella pneumoniae subsp. ozaenae]
MSLKEKTQTLFADAFGYPASHVIQAPGRVNLIGEHTITTTVLCCPALSTTRQ